MNNIFKKNHVINYSLIGCLFISLISFGRASPEFSLMEFIPRLMSKSKKAVDTPSILFIVNSAQIYREKEEDDNMYEQKVKIIIERAKRIFDEETSTVIEICGHCDSREINKKKLSLARAQYIADELIKKGISKKRIVVKGEGDEEPVIREKTIKEASTQEDKENFYLQNRRVTFKILKWNYKE